MAKRKNAQPWDAVFDQVQISGYPDWVSAPHATDDELDTVESQLSLRLPSSYREFMKRFGPGELERWVRLDPITPGLKGHYTLAQNTTASRELNGEGQNRNAMWLGRVVYFASSAGGDSYVWDPEEVTRTKPHECQFYYLRRGSEAKPRPAGKTFAEFIQWVEADVRSWSEDDSSVSIPGFRFHQFVLRKKKVPKKPDVKLWLAWNNYTPRDLALSIRDRGQTDAFPILADALQEAGCDNADLLDSCRTGDPDIDGKWALQVLLGSAATK